jgi:hypothetical protein
MSLESLLEMEVVVDERVTLLHWHGGETRFDLWPVARPGETDDTSFSAMDFARHHPPIIQ